MLVVIDAFSKYALAQPIKKKTGKEVTEAFGRISKEAQGRKPQKLETDAGKEFYSGTFQEFVKSHGIHHFSTHGDAKASVAEIFIHTLKSKLYRYFTAANTWMCFQNWWINTTAPFIGVFKPPLPKSHRLRGNK